MIKINKQEAQMLRDKGLGYDVHMSSATHKGRAKRYYMTESAKSMKALNNYRKKTTVKEGK